MPSSPPNPRAAYCEEYSEDAHTTLPETRQTANIAAKRSRPEITKLRVADTREERSDSGNSSQTVATLNSGDSSLESKAAAKPSKLNTRPPALRRRPTLPSKRSEYRPPGPQKSSQKRNSSKTRDERSTKTERCKCSECKAEARKSLTPLETSWPATVNRQVRPKHEVHDAPQSAKPPPSRTTPDVLGHQAAPPRPRAATAQGYKTPRPLSYHGAVPGVLYVQQPQPQPVQFERRAQTPYAMPLTYPPPSFPPNRGSHFPAPQALAPRRQDSFPFPPSPYELQPRPQPRPWAAERSSHRHSMIYTSPPVIEYATQPQYIPRPPSAQPIYRASQSYYDPSPSPLENAISLDEDFYRMPPPPAPLSKPQQRPAMRHAATTSTAHPLLHHPHGRRIEDTKDRGSGHRSPRKEQVGEHNRSRRPSLTSRPSATPSSDKPHAHLIEHGLARMNIESNEAAAKQRRRSSYYGHENPHDLERVAETYQDHVKTTADGLPLPVNSDSLKLVRKKTHSDTGSRGSAEGRGSREGSDVKPRSSTDRRSGSDVKSRDDGVTVRFNPASVNLDVKRGTTDGRTISFRQSREAQGEMELSIGAKERHGLSRTASRNEARERHTKTYPSVRGFGGVREVEVARSTSRARGEREPGRDRTRSIAASRSRRSSKSGYSGKGTLEGMF